MLAFQRTYRFVAALMAVLLLMGGILPLVQHACAMMEAKMTLANRCCCDDEAPMPTHTQHPTPVAPASDMPCQDEMPSSDSDADHGDDCCTVEITRTAPEETTLLTRTPDLHTAITLLFVADVLADHPAPRADAPVFDTGPPLAPPQPLHILHGSFLN